MADNNDAGAAEDGRTAQALGRRIGRAAMAVHRSLYKATGGRLGGKVFGGPVLLLTVTGRKTGKRRTTPLMYLVEADKVVVVASNGGSDRMPTWYLNLRSNPQVEIQQGRDREVRSARDAEPDERAELWPKFVEMYSGYEGYAAKTTRRIPVVVLEETSNPPPSIPRSSIPR